MNFEEATVALKSSPGNLNTFIQNPCRSFIETIFFGWLSHGVDRQSRLGHRWALQIKLISISFQALLQESGNLQRWNLHVPERALLSMASLSNVFRLVFEFKSINRPSFSENLGSIQEGEHSRFALASSTRSDRSRVHSKEANRRYGGEIRTIRCISLQRWNCERWGKGSNCNWKLRSMLQCEYAKVWLWLLD